MIDKLAPIAVFAFNRPDLLRTTLQALSSNALAEASALTIFCDGPRTEAEQEKTDAVRKVARGATGFASVQVVERENNLGCANAVINGLTEMFAQHERLIVIEDDILCSPYTLQFLNNGLDFYESYKTVFNIAAWSPPVSSLRIPQGYPYDVFAIARFNCWGWASWKDRFEDIDWAIVDYETFKDSSFLRQAFNRGGLDMSPMLDLQMQKKIDTWDIRVDYARFKKGRVGVNPVFSYTMNIGMDSGTHTDDGYRGWDTDIRLAKNPLTNFRWVSHIFLEKTIERSYQIAVAREGGLIKRIYRPIKRVLRVILKSLHLLEPAKKTLKALRLK